MNGLRKIFHCPETKLRIYSHSLHDGIAEILGDLGIHILCILLKVFHLTVRAFLGLLACHHRIKCGGKGIDVRPRTLFTLILILFRRRISRSQGNGTRQFLFRIRETGQTEINDLDLSSVNENVPGADVSVKDPCCMHFLQRFHNRIRHLKRILHLHLP